MGTIQTGLCLVLAVTRAEMECKLESDIAITHSLSLAEGIAPHSAPVTKHVHATFGRARSTGTFLSGPSFPAVVKRAGQVSEFVIEIAPSQNLDMVGLTVLH